MKKILIGSNALKFHFPDLNREPKDVDYAVSEEGVRSNVKGVEYLYNPVITKVESESIISKENLLTLKMSHLFWDVNWEKHVYDVLFLQSKGVKYDKDLFYELYDFHNELHKNSRSDLKMTADDFFNNAIKSEYDHDFIHTIIKEVPTYTKVLKDNSEVEPDENKFHSFSFEDKCGLVQEEVMVMAWERYKKLGYLHAYYKMFKKFLISHAPMWEALFIIENFNALYKAPFDYVKKINNELQIN